MKSENEKLPDEDPPTNICSSMLSGVAFVMMRNASPRLNVWPTLTSVVLTPDAIPRLCAGTEFIMEDLLGDANIPIPLPTSMSGIAIASKVTVADTVKASSMKPTADTTSPIVEMPLAPKRSDSIPLTGPNATSDADMGMRKMPASSGFSLIVGP